MVIGGEESRQKRKFSRSSIAGFQVVKGGHSADGCRNVLVTKADLAAVSR